MLASIREMKKIILIVLVLSVVQNCFGQSSSDFETLSQKPKSSSDFPLDYKILLPRVKTKDWNMDYNNYKKYLNKRLIKTQMSISSKDNGMTTWLVTNSIIPHAQLDTVTMIKDDSQLLETWRMLTYRSIRFNDSVTKSDEKYYRTKAEELDNKSEDEVFVTIDKKKYKMFVKEKGKSTFKKKMQAKYSIENNGYIMLYKLSKSASGVSQIGIDENGNLIMNYPKVIEYNKQGEYISYYAIIEQFIFEKVR